MPNMSLLHATTLVGPGAICSAHASKSPKMSAIVHLCRLIPAPMAGVTGSVLGILATFSYRK
jgi:hypothetical protein